MVDGTIVSRISDNDQPNGATITGTAIVEMQPGQKVSDCLNYSNYFINKKVGNRKN